MALITFLEFFITAILTIGKWGIYEDEFKDIIQSIWIFDSFTLVYFSIGAYLYLKDKLLKKIVTRNWAGKLKVAKTSQLTNDCRQKN